MNDDEKLQGDSGMVVEIRDEEPYFPRSSKAEPPRLPLGAKLIALWNFLFVLAAWYPAVAFLGLLGDDWGVAAAFIGLELAAGVHAAASAAVFGHYKRKYGVSARGYVLTNALPLLLITAALLLFTVLLYINHDFGFMIFGLFCFGFLAYSAGYAALLSAALWIRRKLEKSKR